MKADYQSDVHVTPILAEDGLYLWDWGNPRNAYKQTPMKTKHKFAKAFRSVWAAIPDKARQMFLAHWHQYDKRGEKSVRPTPYIELNSRRLQPRQAAACGYGGWELLFSVRHIEYAAPKRLEHSIAHELGHAMSYLYGWYKLHECGIERGGECTACECQAYSVMAHWGFDPFLKYLKQGKNMAERFYESKGQP